MTAPAPKAPVDPTARGYLQDNHVAALLEAFVTDLVQERPKNVLEFMQSWASTATRLFDKPSGDVAENGEQPPTQEETAESTAESGSPAMGDEELEREKSNRLQRLAVRQSWATLQQAEDLDKLVSTFFTVVTTQHTSLKHTLLKEADFEALGKHVIHFVGGVVDETLTEGDLKEAAMAYGIGKEVDARHYDYFLTAMLTALSIHLKDDFPAVSEAWRVVLTTITDIVRQVLEAEKELSRQEEEEGHAAASGDIVNDENRAIELVRDSWNSIEDCKVKISDQFLQLLLLQHASLKRTVFKDVDLEVASTKLTELFDGVIAGSLDEGVIEALALQHAVEYGIDSPKHAAYFITTMLTTLQLALGEKFAEVAEPWRLVLTSITEAVERGARAFESQASIEVPSTTAPAAEEQTTEKGSAVEENAENPEATQLHQKANADALLESWRGISDKAQFAKTFFTVITTQHPVIQRSVLKDVDLAAMSTEHFVPLMVAYMEGKLDDEALKAKTIEFGAEQKLQERFYHYCITAFLTAVSLTISKEDFALLSEPWRLKVTYLCDFVSKTLAEHHAAIDAAGNNHEAATDSTEAQPAAENSAPAEGEAQAEGTEEKENKTNSFKKTEKDW